MYKLDAYRTIIDVRLKNGAYLFSNSSGTGKTFLAKTLSKYATYGEPVASYTYGDDRYGRSLKELLISDALKLIVLDRYDMYYGECLEEINRKPRNNILLIDAKQYKLLQNLPTCSVHLTKEGIIVL